MFAKSFSLDVPGAVQEVEREVEEADAGGRKRKRRVHAVEYCYEPELEGGDTCIASNAYRDKII